MNEPRIEIPKEEPIPLRKCHEILPLEPSERRLYRWAREGVRAGSTRIYLEIIWVGTEKCTTREAFDRFMKEITAAKMSLD